MLYNSEHLGDEMAIGRRVLVEDPGILSVCASEILSKGSGRMGSGPKGLPGGVLFAVFRPLIVRPLSIWNRGIGDPRAKKFSQSKARRRFCSAFLSVEPLLEIRARLPGQPLPAPCSGSCCRHRMSNRIALPRECPTKLT